MPFTTTPHIPNPGFAQVAVSAGEFLVFVLDAGGPVPNFTQAGSVSGIIMNESRFPGVQARYAWNYLRSSTDQHNFEVIVTGVQFLANADYRLRIAKSDGSGTTLTDVMDIEWTGGSPSEFTSEGFTVVLR